MSHLPSNSSEKFFPDNTLTRFKTKLHNTMTLRGEWECGLSEILFVKSWNNVTSYGGEKIIATFTSLAQTVLSIYPV